MSDDLCYLQAVEAAQLIREQKLSPVELIRALLDRIDTLNPHLHAYITVCGETAMRDARAAEQAIMQGNAGGPLHGLAFAVKDLLFTAGVTTTAGSPIYKNFIPQHDARVVQRLRDAGAILLGKTSTPEFGFKSTTENQLIGQTNNPWDQSRTAGGSSGGAAAATAAGMAPLSVGTDAGGSIRTPASFCGIVGLKPTFGVVPGGPGFGGGVSIVHTGPMTRSVNDCALMFAVMAGPDEYDRRTVLAPAPFRPRSTQELTPFRVGFSPDLGYAAVDESVAACVEACLRSMADAGWKIESAELQLDDPETAFNTIIRAENYVFARELAARHAAQLDPDYLDFTARGAELSAFDYLAADQVRDELNRSLADLFQRFDLLITPSLAVPPFKHGQRPTTVAGRAISGMNWLSFTYPFNLSGHPAACIPAGFSADGLPIGLQIVAPRFAEARLLQACAEVERVCPWSMHRPVVTT